LIERYIGNDATETSVTSRKHGNIKHKNKQNNNAWLAQLIERVVGNDEVVGLIPMPGLFVFWEGFIINSKVG
jgi:hypothetical protein